ncbi:hypothetical protein ACLOJK_027474 [Asimina triloba]
MEEARQEPRQRAQAGESPAVSQSFYRQDTWRNNTRETSTARSHARRAPTNANKLDQVIERVVESRMAQEAIRLELVSKLETLQRSVADVATFVMKINEKQALQDAEMTFLRRRLEALQTQLNETSLGKRKAETSPDVLEQLMREAEIRQPVPRRRVKMAVSKKRFTYPNLENEEPVEEIPPQEEGLKEPPVAPESNSRTNFTIPNPPSPTPEETVPPAEPVTMKVPSQKPPRCPKCKFLHTGKCALQPNTYFRCMQPGHQAKDYLYEMVCNGCKEPGHLARECPKREQRRK